MCGEQELWCVESKSEEVGQKVGSGRVSERSEEAAPISHGSAPWGMHPFAATWTVGIRPSFHGWLRSTVVHTHNDTYVPTLD